MPPTSWSEISAISRMESSSSTTRTVRAVTPYLRLEQLGHRTVPHATQARTRGPRNVAEVVGLDVDRHHGHVRVAVQQPLDVVGEAHRVVVVGADVVGAHSPVGDEHLDHALGEELEDPGLAVLAMYQREALVVDRSARRVLGVWWRSTPR